MGARMCTMKIIRKIYSDMSKIHMFQSNMVVDAANHAHLRNATRGARSYEKVNQATTRPAKGHAG